MFEFLFSQQPTQEQIDRMNAQHTSGFLKFYEFVESLDETQMLSLLQLLHDVRGDESHNDRIAGLLQGRLRWDFNRCFCSEALGEHSPKDHDNPSFVASGGATKAEESAVKTNAEAEAAMMEYRMIWRFNSEGKTLHCKDCGMLYQSLEDRMLRSPGVEGCMGCQDVAKHGGGNPWR
jgi:hypothetical protein